MIYYIAKSEYGFVIERLLQDSKGELVEFMNQYELFVYRHIELNGKIAIYKKTFREAKSTLLQYLRRNNISFKKTETKERLIGSTFIYKVKSIEL